MKNWAWLVLVISMVLGAACSRGGRETSAGTLVLTGASTIAPLMSEIAKQFEAAHPGVRIDVQAGGSSRGIADTQQGLASIGMVSRALKESEKDLQGFVIARDGICIIVNKQNPVAALTDAQVVAIYTGKITQWRDVGGPDGPITVVNKAEGRSTFELFMHHFGLKPVDVKAHVIIGDNEQGIKTVEGNPNAIGYVSIGTAEYSEKHGGGVRLLPMSGVAPSTASVRDGTFPLARPLLLVTKAVPEGLTKTFLDYATSAQVNKLIQEQYFVPVKD